MGYQFFLPMVLRWRASRAEAPLKNKLVMNCLSDIFNVKEEDTNGKRYNLRNAGVVLPGFKTVSYGKHSLRFLGPQL